MVGPALTHSLVRPCLAHRSWPGGAGSVVPLAHRGPGSTSRSLLRPGSLKVGVGGFSRGDYHLLPLLDGTDYHS